jgi:hypothetical protein|tara:strand:- start:3257 stop:3781 length:525 start_codon:yes stop_codon:yes gene_type:complete
MERPETKHATVSRAFLAVGFVATTIVTTGLTVSGNWWLGVMEDNRAEVRREIGEFATVSRAFDAAFRVHAQNISRHLPLERSREDVSANLLQQLIELESARPYLPPEGVRVADNYEKILANINRQLLEAEGPAEAGPLFQEVAYLVDVRENLVSALRGEAGLPIEREPDSVSGS